MINRRVPKKIDTEQFHRFGAVFVKADRETGKVVRKPCVFTRQSGSMQHDSGSVCSDCVTRDEVALYSATESHL